MKYLNRLKFEKGLSGELQKLQKTPFYSFCSSEGRHFPENVPPIMRGKGFQVPTPVDDREVDFNCFSPDGTLEASFREAVEDGWDDGQLMEYIDAMRLAGVLKVPWGFMVKDSPLIGSYWILSETTARERIPAEAMSFTLEELRPIVETYRVFPEAKVIKIIRHKEKGAVDA